MAAVLDSGDYVETDGALLECDYIDELLQNIEMALKTPRGAFYPDSSFGSYLHALGDTQPQGLYALAWARQALAGFDGVYVKSATVSDSLVILDLVINGEERQANIDR